MFLFIQDDVDVSSPFPPLPTYIINTAMCYDPSEVPLDSDSEEEDGEDNDEDSNFGDDFFN